MSLLLKHHGLQVFVADKLSDTNKKRLNSLKVEWVKMRSDGGFRRFESFGTFENSAQKTTGKY